MINLIGYVKVHFMRIGKQISRAKKCAKLVLQGKLDLSKCYKISNQFGTLVESYYQELLMAELAIINQRNALVAMGIQFGKEYFKASEDIFNKFSQIAYGTNASMYNLSTMKQYNLNDTNNYFMIFRGAIDNFYQQIDDVYIGMTNVMNNYSNKMLVLNDSVANAIKYDAKYLNDALNLFSLGYTVWSDTQELFTWRDGILAISGDVVEGTGDISDLMKANAVVRKNLMDNLKIIQKYSNQAACNESMKNHQALIDKAMKYLKESK